MNKKTLQFKSSLGNKLPIQHPQKYKSKVSPPLVSPFVNFYTTPETNKTPSVTVTPPTLPDPSITKTPWTNGQINGYYMWAENFVNSSPAIQFFPNSITSPQSLSNGLGVSSNSSLGSQQFVYNGYTIPSGTNGIFFFTGYSNAVDCLNVIVTGGMYTDANSFYAQPNNYKLYEYPNGSTILVGPCFGGSTVNGGWSPGTSGAIYSIYQAATAQGQGFSYYETGTGNTLTGKGTGLLRGGTYNGITTTYTFNSLVFDIETWGTNGGSTGQDFLNLFTYIKTNSNSVFSSTGVIIIVTNAHSCSNYNGTGQSVCSTIFANQGYYPGNGTTSNPLYTWDYISPQMYTQNTGTMNEYAANSNIFWTGTNSFYSYITQNSNINTYGLNLILPSILQPNLYSSGGTNNGNSPNLYFYQSSPTNFNPIVEQDISAISIPYTIDTGVVSFMNAIFGVSGASLGGYLSFLNGTLGPMPTSPPSNPITPNGSSNIWLDANNNYWAMYVGGSNVSTPFNNPIYIPSGTAYNTLICQVYGAGGGGGGGATSFDSNTGSGGGGGAGTYCCFSISAADPVNGLIELYIPSGGGGGGGGSYGGGIGGGGGCDGNGAGDLNVTNTQIPTSVWWNSNSLNGSYTMVASCPSGNGGMGFTATNIFQEAFPNNPFVQQVLPFILDPSNNGLTPSQIITVLGLIATAYTADYGLAKATEIAELINWLNAYNVSIQGNGGTAPTPNLNNIGSPYGSYQLNSLSPIQSGSSVSGAYLPSPVQNSSGGAVNNLFSTTTNPYLFGYGGNGNVGNGNNGYPGAVIFTLTNSTPGNSI